MKEEKPSAAPVVGEIAKTIRVSGATVAQSADGENLCLKLPMDKDGHQLIFAFHHEDADEIIRLMQRTADEMTGVRARRRAGG